MNIKASIATLFGAALLAGCTISSGPRSSALQVATDTHKISGERADTKSELTIARLQEELRVATERTRLAEERAELEKRKREFAEERLKRLETTDATENTEGSPGDEAGSGGS